MSRCAAVLALGCIAAFLVLYGSDVATVPEATWRTQFYLDRWLADQVAQEIVPFLREKKLSLFRSLRGP